MGESSCLERQQAIEAASSPSIRAAAQIGPPYRERWSSSTLLLRAFGSWDATFWRPRSATERAEVHRPEAFSADHTTPPGRQSSAGRGASPAERWVGSIRPECLDRILIVSRRQLETVLREYAAYYNTHRPHRSLEQQPPLLKVRPVTPTEPEWRVRRRDRLGGLLHEYELAA